LQEEYKKQLASAFLANGENAAAGKILAFKSKAPAPPAGLENAARGVYSSHDGADKKAKKTFRHVPSAPERILDAPELIDDYYLNLIDWGASNQVAVALGGVVYLWNAESGDITQLMQTSPENEEDYVTSVQWGADGKHIAVGTNAAEVQIWDVTRLKQVRTLRGHSARVGALAWNGTSLATGSRDNTIMMHDVRVREHCTATLTSHTQEVCGLKWAPSGNQLASGGNDNLLHIWDHNSIGNGTHVHRLDAHQAAVKALAWCPFQSNLLASGGGTADRCIKFWNTTTGAMLNSVDTHSQVCALQWNTHERELLSSHGYSQNQLCLWKYPTMTKMAEFTGHSARVLHMAQSPDGNTVVSAAADETLRFWKCFSDDAGGGSKTKKAKESADGSVLRRFAFR
jgi:cell division cycle protein 20 (cofactor of APC complex)